MKNYTVACYFCNSKWTVKTDSIYDHVQDHSCAGLIAYLLKYKEAFEKDIKAGFHGIRLMAQDAATLERVAKITQDQLKLAKYNKIYSEEIKYIAPKIGAKPKKCNARCMGAYGPSCDCSCKAENHGASHRL